MPLTEVCGARAGRRPSPSLHPEVSTGQRRESTRSSSRRVRAVGEKREGSATIGSRPCLGSLEPTQQCRKDDEEMGVEIKVEEMKHVSNNISTNNSIITTTSSPSQQQHHLHGGEARKCHSSPLNINSLNPLLILVDSNRTRREAYIPYIKMNSSSNRIIQVETVIGTPAIYLVVGCHTSRTRAQPS